jgi:hypothetical protein
MAEFKANCTESASTGVAPFVATKGYLLRMGIEPPMFGPDLQSLTAPARNSREKADQLAEKLAELREYLKLNIAWAQAKQAEYANQDRLLALAFKVDDLVIIDSRHLQTTRPNKSLNL